LGIECAVDPVLEDGPLVSLDLDPVVPDVVHGKVWAALDPTRRASR
jgi:hypothetical protein